ncbi:17000_t:CDS:2, partial [Rhizophagus irregularis]
MGAIKTFRELLYEEEGIATNEKKVKELMSNMEYGNIDIENVHEYHRNMVQKIIRIFIDTRGFTKEPEDSESEDSLESYEMKKNFNTSLYLRFERFRYWWNDKYEDSMTFKDSEDIDVRDSIILKIDDGVIEWIEGRFDKSEDIKEWMDLSTKICNRCNKQKLDYMISEENGRCEECNQEIREEEQDELIELKNNLEKLGYTIDVSEIQRIKNFGVNNRIMVTEEFIERYMRIIELGDKELRREIHKWLNENTTCARIDIGKDDNRQNMFAKPLSDNYEDELVKAFEEKARISKLEGLVSNIERRLNNDNRN